MAKVHQLEDSLKESERRHAQNFLRLPPPANSGVAQPQDNEASRMHFNQSSFNAFFNVGTQSQTKDGKQQGKPNV